MSNLFLILLIASVYAPFLGTRLIRMAGDEKVYINQAIEMAQSGNWFLQRLHGEPNYYKGPLHYILLRFGMILFGKTVWAVLYMNFFLVILGALALAKLVRRRLPEWPGGDVWIGVAFALGVGVYSHTWASQMECELASLFAVSLYLLDSISLESGGFLFWILAGLLGWAKSPLHAALAGTTAILFWILRGELFQRMKNPKSWLALITGIAVGVGGYLPAFILDRQNFWNTYIIRENFAKSFTGQTWTVSIVSVFGFYLIPWMLVAFVAYLQFLSNGFGLAYRPTPKRMISLALAGFIPSVAFFIWHPYHFENYNLPVISAIWLLIATVVSQTRPATFWSFLYTMATRFTGLIFLLIPLALGAIVIRLTPMPLWWPDTLLPLVVVSCLLSAWAFFSGNMITRPRRLAFGGVAFLWGLTALFSVLGERELVSLRDFIAAEQSQGHPTELAYFNLNRNIWSEWGYLNFWLHRDVHALNSPEEAKAAMLKGETILVLNKEDGVENFKKFAAKEVPQVPLTIIPWKRWRTQGKTESGDPLWKEAWKVRSLAPLEVDYAIVKTKS